MNERQRTFARLLVATVTLAAVVLLIFIGQDGSSSAAQSNFVGTPPSRPDSSDIRALRLRFEPGSRSNWHSHSNWQILMAEDGRGRTQVRGEALQELVPGQPMYTGPNVVHWHGADPDEHLLQLTFVSGQTDWQDPVSDDDYLGGQ